MNQVQFFYDEELFLLQEKINKWLQEHKQVEVLFSNLSSLGKPSQRAGVVATEKYVFYILYKTEEVAEAAIAAAAVNDIPVVPPELPAIN